MDKHDYIKIKLDYWRYFINITHLHSPNHDKQHMMLSKCRIGVK